MATEMKANKQVPLILQKNNTNLIAALDEKKWNPAYASKLEIKKEKFSGSYLVICKIKSAREKLVPECICTLKVMTARNSLKKLMLSQSCYQNLKAPKPFFERRSEFKQVYRNGELLLNPTMAQFT